MQKFYIKVVPLLGQLGEASYRCFHPVTVINPLQSALASQSTTTAVLQVKKLVAALTINIRQEEAEAVMSATYTRVSILMVKGECHTIPEQNCQLPRSSDKHGDQ